MVIAPRAYGIEFLDSARGATQALLPGADEVVQRRAPAGARPGGLPDGLRDGVERLSGLAMDDVRIHRGSPEPARIGALAFTRGRDIHVGPGQERHLPHEAWHVVQQAQGRVPATTQFAGAAGNADAGLEREADVMGARAAHAGAVAAPREPSRQPLASGSGGVVQGKFAFNRAGLANTQSRTSFADRTSRLTKILKALERYDKARGEADELAAIDELLRHTTKWMRKHGLEQGQDLEKKTLIKDLIKAATKERASLAGNEFLADHDAAKPLGVIAAVGDPFKHALPFLDNLEEQPKLARDMHGGHVESMRKYGHLGLLPAERAAIRYYTDRGFQQMNPALADNKEWFKSGLEKWNSDVPAHAQVPFDDDSISKAMRNNRRIADMTAAGMRKLPNWKHNQDLYRGETMSDEEVDALKGDRRRRFPHFVSTSMKTTVPHRMKNANVSAARPNRVLYIIKQSSGGKDVTWLSGISEDEVLFLPGTVFNVTAVDEQANNVIECEVTCVGGR